MHAAMPRAESASVPSKSKMTMSKRAGSTAANVSVRNRQTGPAVLTGGAASSVGVDSVRAVLVPTDRAAKHVDPLSLRSADVGFSHDLLSVGIAVADARRVLPRRGDRKSVV